MSTNSLLELADTTETLAFLSLELSSPSWTASTSSVCALRLGTEVRPAWFSEEVTSFRGYGDIKYAGQMTRDHQYNVY